MIPEDSGSNPSRGIQKSLWYTTVSIINVDFILTHTNLYIHKHVNRQLENNEQTCADRAFLCCKNGHPHCQREVLISLRKGLDSSLSQTLRQISCSLFLGNTMIKRNHLYLAFLIDISFSLVVFVVVVINFSQFHLFSKPLD